MTTFDRMVALIRRRNAHGGWHQLVRVTECIEEAERLLKAFRAAHPDGHRCPVCDFIRERDRLNRPCGPSTLIPALHMACWQFGGMMRADLDV